MLNDKDPKKRQKIRDLDHAEATSAAADGSNPSQPVEPIGQKPINDVNAKADSASANESNLSQSAEPTGQKPPNRVNLREVWGEEERESPSQLEQVRLDNSQVVVIPFTSDGSSAPVHYCDEPEIRGYVHCNGRDCVLCRAGRNLDLRLLLPVYLPTTRVVAVLPISNSSRPGALRPPIYRAPESRTPVALRISKPDRAKFVVESVELDRTMDDGADVIAAFMTRWNAGELDLGSIYARLTNRELAEIPAIATLLRYAGGSAGD